MGFILKAVGAIAFVGILIGTHSPMLIEPVHLIKSGLQYPLPSVGEVSWTQGMECLTNPIFVHSRHWSELLPDQGST